MSTNVKIFRPDTSTELPLIYADAGIRAGFPSPAQDYISETIDLNKDLISNPASTFYGRVVGDSMIEEGITEGDILVIDRSVEPENDDLAVCCLDGEFTLKRIRRRPCAARSEQPPLPAYRNQRRRRTYNLGRRNLYHQG